MCKMETFIIVTHKYSVWYKLGQTEKLFEEDGYFFFLLFLLQKVVDKLFDTSCRSLFLEKNLTEASLRSLMWNFNNFGFSGLLNILVLWR